MDVRNVTIRKFRTEDAVFGSIALLTGRSFAQVLIMGVTFFLGSIPEGLPVTVTTCMALSVRRMAKKNAIVRKLPSVEALGAANVICCDKTGTLTMNQMTVRNIYTDKKLYHVTGTGYNPDGEINVENHPVADQAGLNLLLTTGLLCNTASLKQTNGNWEVQGDPTEGALIVAAHKGGLDVEQIKSTHTCMKEIPFDSKRCYMTSVVKNHENKFTVHCKGAFETLIKKCSYINVNKEIRPLTVADRERLQLVCDDMAYKGLRVLAFAYKDIQHEEDDAENDLILIGTLGMDDPPKAGVKASIKKCFKAGIKVVMITGDHPKTACAIGKDLGLYTNGRILTGVEVEHMTEPELDSLIGEVQIFARTTPEQKYRIVKAFKRCGHIVAMTGDGVNDAPAIKEAHIGIAMGKNGSDVAREAACITLVDDDFTTIVAAIEEGRSVTANIKKIVRYLFGGAIGEMLAIFLAFITGSPAPLLAIQMIWINLVSETLIGSALASDPPDEEIMDQPAASIHTSLFDRKMLKRLVRRGIGIALSTFILFKGSLMLGAGLAKARTLAFTTFIGSQIFNAYDISRNKRNQSNRHLQVTVKLALIMLLGILYIPGLSSLFGAVPLNPIDITAVMAGIFIGRI